MSVYKSVNDNTWTSTNKAGEKVIIKRRHDGTHGWRFYLTVGDRSYPEAWKSLTAAKLAVEMRRPPRER